MPVEYLRRPHRGAHSGPQRRRRFRRQPHGRHSHSAVPRRSAAVQHITMNDASKLAIGQAHYSAHALSRREPSSTTSSCIAWATNDYLLVINAGTREKDVNWVRDNTTDFDGVQVEDLATTTPRSPSRARARVETLQKLTDADLSKIKNYWFTHGTVCGLQNTLIARTGYTGEDGFEIYVPADEATSARVWNEVMEAGQGIRHRAVRPGSRNTLRLEGAMALYGHEISEDDQRLGSRPRSLSVRWTRATSSAATRCSKPKEAGPEAHAGRPRNGRSRHPARRIQGASPRAAKRSATSPAARLLRY